MRPPFSFRASHSPLTKTLALCLAVSTLIQCVAAPMAEAGFWEERRLARSVPVGAPVGLGEGPGTAPRLERVMDRALAAEGGGRPIALARVPESVSRVQSYRRGSGDGPLFVLLQDAHRVPSAQLNISRTLELLENGSRRLVVGVEGASGAFEEMSASRWSDGAERDAVSEWMVHRGVINGSEHFGFRARSSTLLWGPEDPVLYRRNVSALHLARAARPALDVLLSRWRASADVLRRSVLSAPARAWDDALARYEAGDGPMAEFVDAIEAQKIAPLPEEMSKLVRVRRWEKETPPARVEADRARFLAALSPRLTAERTDALLRETADYRLGRSPASHYYALWREWGEAHGVRWRDYPALRGYVDAMIEAESVSSSRLFEELDGLRHRVDARVASTRRERETLEWLSDVRCLHRLAALELVWGDWRSVRGRQSALCDLDRRLSALLGDVPSTDERRVSSLLAPHFVFYESAEARNNALVDALRAFGARVGADTIVLVAGGFHSNGLEDRLRNLGAHTAVVTPVLAAMESGSSAIDAFTVQRTPLERLLMGPKLDLAPPSAFSRNPLGDAGLRPLAERWRALGRSVWQLGVQDTPRGFESWATSSGLRAENVRFRSATRSARVDVGGVAAEVRAVPASDGGEAADVLSDPAEGAEVVALRTGETSVVGDVRAASSGGFWRRWGAAARAAVERAWPEAVAASIAISTGLVGGPVEWLTGTALGGLALRAILTASVLWHGLGHALVLNPARRAVASLATYDPAGWRALVPGLRARIWFRSEEAPALALPLTVSSQRLRIAAVAGPMFSAAASTAFAASASLHAFPPCGDLILWAGATINAAFVAGSWSDFLAFRRGRAAVLNCGVIGVAFGGPNPNRRPIPPSLGALLDRATRRTLHRGGQSGGVATVVSRENGHLEVAFRVEKAAKEKDRRALLARLMTASRERLAALAERDGYGGMKRIVTVAHTRYGTNLAPPVAANAHPHLSASRTETRHYLGDAARNDRYERPWALPAGPVRMKSAPAARGVAIAHNGDDNATTLYRWSAHRSLVVSNDEDARISEKMTGHTPTGRGDSPQIATRMDRWITAGSVRGALALSLLMVGLSTLSPEEEARSASVLDRVPDPARVVAAAQVQAFSSFEEALQELSARFPRARTLEELYRSVGADFDPIDTPEMESPVPIRPGSPLSEVRARLVAQAGAVLGSSEWYRALSVDERRAAETLWVDLFLKYFFTNDLRRAGIQLLKRADPTSTYGLMASSLSEPENVVWARSQQPFYLWLSEDGRTVAGGSESTAFLGGIAGESPMSRRLTMKNGEVAFLAGERLVIDHATDGRVAEFDLSDLSSIARSARWLDLRQSARVPRPTEADDDPATRTRRDFDAIPRVDRAVARDFENPRSENCRAAGALARRLVERLSRPVDGEIDLVIVGTEKSYDEGSLFGAWLEKLSSLAGRRLRVEYVYGAEFTREELLRLRDRGFSSGTVVVGLASSGQTANTFYALESLYAAWRARSPDSSGPPPHFLVSAHMDNPYTEEVLGQGLADGDPFVERNLVTFPGLDPFHPSEAATVTHKATERLLKEVALVFARELSKQRGQAGLRLSPDKTARLRRMIDNGDELNRRIVGLDEEGNPHGKSRGEENAVPGQIAAMGTRIRQALLENLWTAAATALFIAFTLLFHITPASVLLSWFPNGALAFPDGLPVLAAGVGASAIGWGAWRTRGAWHPVFSTMGAALLGALGVLGGGALTLGLDALGGLATGAPWGTALGRLPWAVDASPVTLLNIATYVFFAAGFTLAQRVWQGRMLWDRFAGRVLVVVDPQAALARLSAARWRRMLNLRFGWMGLYSVNESSLGRMTHEEAANTNIRGALYIQNESRSSEGATAMNFKQLGGSPNGRGRAWRMGIGHKPVEQAGQAFTEGYVSLAMPDDNPAGDDPDLLALQEHFQDAGARDTAGMALALNVAEGLANLPPLNFVIGQTSSEAKTSTTQQPHPPLDPAVVRDVFGVPAPRSPRAAAPRSRSTVSPAPVIEPPAAPVFKPSLKTVAPPSAVPPSALSPRESQVAGAAVRWARRGLRLALLGLLLAAIFSLRGSDSRLAEVRPAFATPLKMALTLDSSPVVDAVPAILRASQRIATKYGGPVLLHDGPDGTTPLRTVVPAGAVVRLVAVEGDWARIGVGAFEGYVGRRFLVPSGGAVPLARSVEMEADRVYRYPTGRSPRVDAPMPPRGIERATFWREGRRWSLIESAGGLFWLPSDAVKDVPSDRPHPLAEVVSSILSGAPVPSAGFGVRPFSGIEDPARGTLKSSGFLLAQAIAHARGGGATDVRSRGRFMEGLRRRGVFVSPQSAEALSLVMPALKGDTESIDAMPSVFNLLGGLRADEFGDNLLRVLRRPASGAPILLLVRNPQQMGAVKRQLRARGLGASLERIRFVPLTRLTAKGTADPLIEGTHASPRVVLSGVLEAGLTPDEYRAVAEVALHTPRADTTQWVAGTDRIRFLIVYLLAGTCAVAPLPQAEDLKRALRVLQSA